MNGPEIVASTSDPAFATDSHGRIVAWNRSAQNLFGYRDSQVLGRTCWDVLAGRDVFGNRYCGPACPLIKMAVKHEAIHRCVMLFSDAVGGTVKVRLSTLAVSAREPGELTVVHLLRPLAENEALDEPAQVNPTKPRSRARLTLREREVLALLDQGKGTTECAELMGVSEATVRNHIDHILHKLKAHSRVEVLALARRIGLLR